MIHTIAEYTGRRTLAFVEHVLALAAFTYRITALIAVRPVAGRALVGKAVVEQIYFTAVQALPIIIPIALMVGSSLILQLSKFSGEFDLGKLALFMIIRETGPFITALVVILRSATAVTVEMSYMTVSREIETLEMCGIDPMWLLAFSRFIGITSAMLCLFVVFDVVAIFGGNLIVWMTVSSFPDYFLGQVGKAITMADLIVGFMKAITFGITITVVSLYHGFRKKDAVTQIPVATSASAIESFFICMLFNFFISAVFYL